MFLVTLATVTRKRHCSHMRFIQTFRNMHVSRDSICNKLLGWIETVCDLQFIWIDETSSVEWEVCEVGRLEACYWHTSAKVIKQELHTNSVRQQLGASVTFCSFCNPGPTHTHAHTGYSQVFPFVSSPATLATDEYEVCVCFWQGGVEGGGW